jgi:hypothetical protein
VEPNLAFEELTSKESAQRISAAGRRVRARLQRLVNQLVLEVDND